MPQPLPGNEVYNRVKNIITIFGKTQKKTSFETNIWKKRSIFFYLPYWSDLHVCHCLDVMHVKKNVYDSLISTLLNIKGKTQDGLKCHQDLVDMGIQEQLHLISQGRRTYLPPAEKISFCQVFNQQTKIHINIIARLPWTRYHHTKHNVFSLDAQPRREIVNHQQNRP